MQARRHLGCTWEALGRQKAAHGGKLWRRNTKKRHLGCKKGAFSPFLVEKVTNSKKNLRVTQKARYVYLYQQKSEDCLTHLSYKLEESRPLYEAL